MKYSQFNSIVSYNDKYHLYNSFTQKFLIIDSLLKDLLESAMVEGIEGLEEVHSEFYSYLKSEEFIVQDRIDEVEKVKELVKEVDENTNNFLLTINPTMNCNFKCWYCYETHIKKSSFSLEMIKKVGRFIEKTARRKEILQFNLALFGGEPLLYFKRDLVPVIEKLQQECIKNKVDYSVGFTTNGYLVNDEFIDFFKSHKITPSLQITLDGYKEKHDAVRYVSSKKGSFDVIIKNIKKLLINSFYVRLRINYTSENISDAYKIADEFDDISLEIKKKFLLLDLHRVWQDSKNDDILIIVEEVMGKFKEKNMPIQHMVPNNVRDSCYADKRNSVLINYNGDLFKCTARDFLISSRVGYLDENGDLIWENNHLEKRMDSKFKNKPCLTCRLLPICNGGCSQHALDAMESGKEYCIYYGDEKVKDDIVVSKVEEIIKPLLELNEV